MANEKLIYAEQVNYWKTSAVAPDKWIDHAKKDIKGIGGKIDGEFFGQDGQGRAAFMLSFTIDTDSYKIVWAVLPCKVNNDANERAARVQAATLLYHDVKHKVVMAKVKGVRSAFLEYYLLPNGQTVVQAATDPEAFLNKLPALPMLGTGR